MKFNKQLQIQTNLRWNSTLRDYYMNYKGLKRLLKELKHKHNKSTLKRPSDADLAIDQHKLTTTFIKAIDRERLIVENFMKMRIGKLKESPLFSNVDVIVEEEDSNAADVKVVGDIQDLFIRRNTREDLFPVNGIPGATGTPDAAENTESPMQVGKKKDILNGLSVKQVKSMDARIDRLQKFFDINNTGFYKIVKKFDKQLGSELNSTISETLHPKIEKKRAHYQKELDELKVKVKVAVDYCLQIAIEEAEYGKEEITEFVMNEEMAVIDEIKTYNEINLDELPRGCISKFKLAIVMGALSEPVSIPVIVAKGLHDGPVLGITSALHGNELNGIPLIFRLFKEMNCDQLFGTVIAIPVLNPPGFVRHQRGFNDGQDLNRLFPGKADGNCGQVYVHQVLNKLIKHFQYHLDLHTASAGRVNSLYVRADMCNAVTHQMSILQESQIIVHNTAPDGSLRSAAMKLGIHSITVEIGDPLSIHKTFVGAALTGVENVMHWLKMTRDEDEDEEEQSAAPTKTTLCARSYWLYAPTGGLLTVKPDVNVWVHKDEVIAIVRNLFGSVITTYRAPEDAIIVGKSTNPICQTGDRIVHLGVVGSVFKSVSNDGHT